MCPLRWCQAAVVKQLFSDGTWMRSSSNKFIPHFHFCFWKDTHPQNGLKDLSAIASISAET
jgi:hypothetical protein